MLLLAWAISKANQTRTCLESFWARARDAVDLFLSGDSPLPRSVDRGPELWDRTPSLGFGSSRSGRDGLMWILCRLSNPTARQPVR